MLGNVLKRKNVEFTKTHTLIVKGFAIICMLMHHLFGDGVDLSNKYQISTYPFRSQVFFDFGVACKVCVAIFVFLTAFGTTRSYERGNSCSECALHFDWMIVCRKRYWELMNDFLSVYILTAFTSFFRKEGFWGVYKVKGIWKGVMSIGIDVLGLAGVFGTPTLNETWWYMSFAYLLIFLLPVFIMFYMRYGLKAVIVMFTIIRILYLCLPRIGVLRIIHNGISYLNTYFFPIILGIWSAKKNILERLYVINNTRHEKMNKKIKWLCVLSLIYIFFCSECIVQTGWDMVGLTV